LRSRVAAWRKTRSGFFGVLWISSGVTVATLKLGEAPEEAQNSPEPSRPHPSDGEGAASAATPAADGPLVRVVRDDVSVSNVREDLRQQKRCVGIAERVVFVIPILGFAGVHEDTDGHGHLASVDEVVEDDGSAYLTLGIEVQAAVLEDHERRRLRSCVLRRDVHPVPAVGVGEDAARSPRVVEDPPAGNAGLAIGVRAVRVADVR
jgi:hypothetical protein